MSQSPWLTKQFNVSLPSFTLFLSFYLYLPVSLQIDKSWSSRPLFHFDCCMSLLVFLLTLHLDVSVLPSIQPTQTARPDPSKLHLTPSPPSLLHLPDRQQIWASPAADSSIWSSGLQVSHLPFAYVALQIPLSSSPPRLFLSIGGLLCTKAWVNLTEGHILIQLSHDRWEL